VDGAATLETGAPADRAGEDLGEVSGEETVGAAVGGPCRDAGGVGAEADAEAPGQGEEDVRVGAYLVEFVAFDDAEEPVRGLRRCGERYANAT